MEYNNKDYIFLVQYADQHESVHGLYQMQNETESVVRIREVSLIQLNKIFKTGSLFGKFSFVSIFNGVYGSKKNALSSDVYLKVDASKTEFFNDCSITDGHVS